MNRDVNQLHILDYCDLYFRGCKKLVRSCVTPILPTKVDHNGSEGKGAVNVALILDLTLHRGVSQITGKKVGIDVGDPRDLNTFEDLCEAFKKQYKYVINRVL
jgi:pyruvate-formate lyase